jgi:hypothetical protein
MNRPIAAAALCAVSVGLLPSCALRPSASLPDVPAAAIEAHLRFLASDELQGRMTGTPEYRTAANYVASQFRQLGLEPAGSEGYFQDVPYAASLIDAPRSSLKIHRGSSVRALKWKDEWVAGGHPTDARVRTRAPAVFVGYGVHAPALGYDSYAEVDVRGKIAIIMAGAPKHFDANPRAYYSSGRVKDEAAAKHGAIGIVTLRNAYSIGEYEWASRVRNAGLIPSMYWLSDEGRASNHQPSLRVEAGLSDNAAQALFRGARYSHEQLLALDRDGQLLPSFALPLEIEMDWRSTVSRTAAPNVAAVLRGSDPALSEEYVVYTAHLDHLGVGAPVDGDAIYNGAYDNAMGVSILIETARVFSAMPKRPRRSILFLAVGGEERGLLGSDYFAEYPTVPRAGLAANINLDMPLFLYPVADVVAFGAEHSTLGPMVDAAARAEGLALSPDPLPDEVIFIRSDQYSLVRRGVPAVYLIPGFNSTDPAVKGEAVFRDFLKNHYHKPSDDLSRPVHWASVVRFTRTNARIGLAAANATQRPRWNPGNFFGELFAGS